MYFGGNVFSKVQSLHIEMRELAITFIKFSPFKSTLSKEKADTK